jgi:hypothetical protein
MLLFIAASARQVALPMPPVAPVTRARCEERSVMRTMLGDPGHAELERGTAVTIDDAPASFSRGSVGHLYQRIQIETDHSSSVGIE